MTITIIGALSAGLMATPTADQSAAAREGQKMTVAGAHTVGAPDGGPGLPGTGWSAEHGDLRVPHFIGIHALQVLPLLAFVLKRRRVRRDIRVRLTLTAAGSYFALFMLAVIQALRGQPVAGPDALMIGLLGVWAAATAICVWKSVDIGSPAGTLAAI
jgi:hypothetical protein